MDHRHLRRTILCMVLAFAMTFAPIFSSYSFISTALGNEETKAAEEQAAATEEGQPAAEGQQEESAKVTDEADVNAEAGETAGSETAETADQDAGKTTEPETAGNEQAAGDTSGVPADDAAKPKTEDPAESEAAAVPEETEAEEPANVRTTYTWENTRMKVTAVLADANAVPDDAELVVTMLDSETDGYNYSAYMEALKTQDANYTEDNTILYDVAFIKDGKEIEPEEGKVSVTFEFLDSQLAKEIGADKAADVSVIHLPLNEDIRNKYDTTADAEDIKAEDIRVEEITAKDNDLKVSVQNEKVVFDTESFSVVALAAPLAAQNDEESEPKVVDIKPFLTNAEVEATKDDTGAYVIRPGAKYSIDLTFAEDIDDKAKQFPNGKEDTMTYALPDGLKAADNDSGKFIVRVNDGGINYSITDNTYKVKDNVIEIKFNTSDENFERLTAAANLTFNIAFEGEFVGENDQVIFDADLIVDFETDTSNSVTADKSSKFNKEKQTIDYILKLKSTGNSTDIKITDILTEGTAFLSYDFSTFEAKSTVKEKVDFEVRTSYSDRIFISIPEMSDGEEITITYSMDVDPSKITVSGGKVTANTNNQVSVTSNEGGDPSVDNAESVIDYTPGIEKNCVDNDPADDTLNWTITANPEAIVPIGGYVITDTIGSASRQYMHYSGSGLHVARYIADSDTPFDEYDVRWEDLNVHVEKEKPYDYTWTYTVPETDQAYKYVITYTTWVQRTGVHKNYNAANEVTITGGGKANKSIVIGPSDGVISITKKASEINLEKGYIEWKARLTVPSGGLEEAFAQVIDTFPSYTLDGEKMSEPVDEDYITVDGLYEGRESYKTSSNDTKTTIDFYKDSVGTSKGLLPSTDGKQRVITITLRTKINFDWLEKSEDVAIYTAHNSIKTHTNKIEVPGIPSSSKQTIIEKPGIEKKVSSAGTRTVNGVKLPVYKYELILRHVTKNDFNEDGILEINDEFDTDLLELYDVPTDSRKVYGGDLKNQNTAGSGQFECVPNSSGMKIKAKKDSFKLQTNGLYYPRYRLVYYLTVSSIDAFREINENASSDKDHIYKIGNVAEWNGKTDDVDIVYEYPGLTKELLTPESELSKTDEDVWAEFRITANPHAQTLNKGKDITLTDTAENLTIDITSVKITVDGEERSDIPFDQSGNVMTYIIPDKAKVVITYRARVVFSKIGDKGETVKVEFNNKVQMLGYERGVSKDSFRDNSGGGVATVPSINLLKHEAGEISKKLAGAKFELLDSTKKNIKDKDNKNVEFIADANGKVTVRGDMERLGWVLVEGRDYYLRETEAPDGYLLANHDFKFTISEDGSENPDIYLYHSGDTINAKNYHETAIGVKKVWCDGNSNHEGDEVTVRLQQKIGLGTWSDTVRMMNPDSEEREWIDTEVTKVLNKGNNWTHKFTGLPLTVPTDADFAGTDMKVTYRIVEIEVDGGAPEADKVPGYKLKEIRYDTKETPAAETEDNIPVSDITVNNIYVKDINVEFDAEKTFEHGDIEDKVFTYTVSQVMGKDDSGSEILKEVATGTTEKTVADSVKSAAENALKSVNAAADKTVASEDAVNPEDDKTTGKVYFSPITYTYDDLKNKDGTHDDSRVFTYVIKEVMPEAAEKNNGYDKTEDIMYDTTVKRVTVTLSLNSKNELVTDIDYGEKDKAEFTNAKKYTKLYLTKSIDQFIGEDTDEEYVNSTVVFRITYDDPVTGETGKTREVSVQFDKDNVAAQTVEVDKVPIDSKLEVKEIYSSNYAPGTTAEPIMVLGENGHVVWTVSIDNTKSRNETGSGVINKITKDGNNYKIIDRQFKPGEEPQPAEGGDDEPVEPVVIEPEAR